MAQSALHVLGLDMVLLIPAREPPHKTLPGGATTAQRLEMLQRVCAVKAGLHVDELELHRAGKSYTADTLQALREQYPNATLYFLMGADMLQSFAAWHEPHAIAALAELVAFGRGTGSRLEAAAASVRADFGARLTLLPPVGAYSSTEIRTRLADGHPIDALVPPCVEDYIYEEGLYLPPFDRALFEDVQKQLSPFRFAHTIGVWREATRLAHVFGLDCIKARRAALLHDVAKELPIDTLQDLAAQWQGGNVNSPTHTALLHAPAGAVLAREKYRVQDAEILQAIALHTTSDADACDLAKLLFIADRSEAGRDKLPLRDKTRLAEIRRESDFNRAYALALSYHIWYIHGKGLSPAPATRRAINQTGGLDGQSI